MHVKVYKEMYLTSANLRQSCYSKVDFIKVSYEWESKMRMLNILIISNWEDDYVTKCMGRYAYECAQ